MNKNIKKATTKDLVNLFLGTNEVSSVTEGLSFEEESLIDKIKRVTAENKNRIKKESDERIRIATEEDTPKYLIICLKQVASAVAQGKYEVKTVKYWPLHENLVWNEQVQTSINVMSNVVKALHQKGFEAYSTSATKPKDLPGNGIHILWEK